MRNKKAISEIVSYTLLIVIVLGIAATVFYFLKVYASKKPSVECPEDLFLVIKSYTCTSSNWELNLTIKNKGYFNISGFYARARRDYENVSTGILKQWNGESPVYLEPELASGQEVILNFNYANFRSSLAAVELQPYIKENDELFLCENSIITQQVRNC